MKTSLPMLTASSCRSYRTCPRLYAYEYLQGYRPVATAEALAFGTLTHLWLEAWWKAAKDQPESPDAWLAAALATLRSEEDPFREVKARAMLVTYHERWKAMTWDGQRIEVLAVEAEYAAPIVNPATGAPSRTFQTGGKIDAIVRIAGHAYTVEHKTTSSDIEAGGEYWSRLRIDAQVSHYHAGMRALGYEPAGCIYDVLKKPDARPHKATPVELRKYTKPTKTEPSRLYANQRETDETPAEFYDRIIAAMAEEPNRWIGRCEVVRLEAEEESAAFDVWQTAAQIRESRNANQWPRNPDSCMRWGRPCAYFDVCSGAASLEDETRFRKAEVPHEELSFGREAVAEAAA